MLLKIILQSCQPANITRLKMHGQHTKMLGKGYVPLLYNAFGEQKCLEFQLGKAITLGVSYNPNEWWLAGLHF